MSIAVALMAGVGILLITTTRSSADLSARIGRYLRPEPHPDNTDRPSREEQPVADAGLAWSRSELLLRRSAAGVAGAVVGGGSVVPMGTLLTGPLFPHSSAALTAK